MNDSHNEARQLLMRFAKEDLEQVTARSKVRYSELVDEHLRLNSDKQVRLYWPIEHRCFPFFSKIVSVQSQ